MDCRKAEILMELISDGLVTEEGALLYSEHLEVCPDCRKEAELLSMMETGLSDLPSPEPPVTLHTGIMKKLVIEEGFTRKGKQKKPVIITAAALLLIGTCVQIFTAASFIQFVKDSQISSLASDVLTGMMTRMESLGILPFLNNTNILKSSGNNTLIGVLAVCVGLLFVVNGFFFIRTPGRKHSV